MPHVSSFSLKRGTSERCRRRPGWSRWLPALLLAYASTGVGEPPPDGYRGNEPQFQTSDRCLACHNGLVSPTGEDVSMGFDWRTSVMANSGIDPYWEASLRRESLDHPESTAAIEDDCATCHMPIARYHVHLQGRTPNVFAQLPLDPELGAAKEYADGVSCSVCHQVAAQNLGTPASYNGGFVVAGPEPGGAHPEYGPFDIDPGLMRVMRSSTSGFQPTHGDQIRSSELCASCHTLITHALGPGGSVIGSLPEQVPYQEWQHSAFYNQQSCQSCHMPAITEPVAITRVLGVLRSGARHHQFIGGNFLLQRMLARYHDPLHLTPGTQEFSAAASRTVAFLQSESARVSVSAPQVREGRLEFELTVQNFDGHKLPTAYPSRRAWLHVTVRDDHGRTVFESGALRPDGSIVGNVNDEDALRFEPHYRVIRSADEVQIYESVLENRAGAVTTALLDAVGYLKDNRLLPRGFDKQTASPDVAVHGDALQDPAFTGGEHRLRYSVALGTATGRYQVDAQLMYQPIGYRWATNLKQYDRAAEPARFNDYYDAMGAATTVTLARAVALSQ
jgi:hypothetical protein